MKAASKAVKSAAHAKPAADYVVKDIGLAEIGFAQRLRSDLQLRRAVAERPDSPGPGGAARDPRGSGACEPTSRAAGRPL